MSESNPSQKIWILRLFIFACFAVAMLAIFPAAQDGRALDGPTYGPTREPSATFDTPGGGQLEILRVAVGKMEFGTARKPRKSFPFLIGSEGSSSGTYGGVNLYFEDKNEATTYLRLESGSPDDLIIEVRLLGATFEPRKISSYLRPNENVTQDDRISPPAQREYHAYHPQGESTDEQLKAMNASGLEVLFQHRDPDSGWIDMAGPGMAWEEWPDRYYVTLDSWQRNQAELHFRMIESDGSIISFRLPNPDFRKTGKPLKAAPLPFVHTAGDLTLTVNRLERVPFTGDHPFAALDMQIAYTGPPVEGLPGGPIHFEGNAQEAGDEWGNVTSIVREMVGGRTMQGIKLPENSRLAATAFTIRRDRNYPQRQGSGISVVEGIVNAAGTSIDFVESPEASRFTKVAVSNCKIGPPAHNIYPATKNHGWKELSFSIECRATAKQYETLQRRLGLNTEWIPLIFAGKDTFSSGLGYSRSGGTSSGSDEVGMKDNFSKILPPHALQPGSRIRIAIHRSPHDEKFEVTLPLPKSVR